MKLITAIVKPFKIDDVKEALKAVGVQGMTVSEAAGSGRQAATRNTGGVQHRLRPQGVIQLVVDDDAADRMVDTIHAAQTGKIGDGKIWVIEVTVRTHERRRRQ
jgi:nitrogen regulatory protein PII